MCGGLGKWLAQINPFIVTPGSSLAVINIGGCELNFFPDLPVIFFAETGSSDSSTIASIGCKILFSSEETELANINTEIFWGGTTL